MNLTINGKAIKKETLIILSLLIAGGITTQVTTVKNFLSNHPRLTPIGGIIISMLTLLHQPWVEQLIFQQTEETPTSKTDTKITVTGQEPVTVPK